MSKSKEKEIDNIKELHERWEVERYIEHTNCEVCRFVLKLLSHELMSEYSYISPSKGGIDGMAAQEIEWWRSHDIEGMCPDCEKRFRIGGARQRAHGYNLVENLVCLDKPRLTTLFLEELSAP